jgi:hypothetical protein
MIFHYKISLPHGIYTFANSVWDLDGYVREALYSGVAATDIRIEVIAGERKT